MSLGSALLVVDLPALGVIHSTVSVCESRRSSLIPAALSVYWAGHVVWFSNSCRSYQLAASVLVDGRSSSCSSCAVASPFTDIGSFPVLVFFRRLGLCRQLGSLLLVAFVRSFQRVWAGEALYPFHSLSTVRGCMGSVAALIACFHIVRHGR